jgi:mono/diheme cytochrome c family protein
VRWIGGFAALALIGALAGCGGGASAARPTGAQVFARDCEMCHSVIGNESKHRVGGDLLGYQITRQQLIEFTREMPVRRPLTQAQLAAVVDYVYALQQRGPSR